MSKEARKLVDEFGTLEEAELAALRHLAKVGYKEIYVYTRDENGREVLKHHFANLQNLIQ